MCHIESVHNLILAFIMEYLFVWEMLNNNDDDKRCHIDSSTHIQMRQQQQQQQHQMQKQEWIQK